MVMAMRRIFSSDHIQQSIGERPLNRISLIVKMKGIRNLPCVAKSVFFKKSIPIGTRAKEI